VVMKGLVNIGEGAFDEIMNELIISLRTLPLFNPARWIELPPRGNVKQPHEVKLKKYPCDPANRACPVECQAYSTGVQKVLSLRSQRALREIIFFHRRVFSLGFNLFLRGVSALKAT